MKSNVNSRASSPTPDLVRRRKIALSLGVLIATGVGVVAWKRTAIASARDPVPKFLQDTNLSNESSSAVAVLAGGCFWGTQAVFQHVRGVISAVSGYAGGSAETAYYEKVESGVTGHAEAVQVTFDPQQIDFAEVLQVFFSVAHDPTQLNRQGPDVGTQYRSAVFPRDPGQSLIARSYVSQLNQSGAFNADVVTTIEEGGNFFPAEAMHQDYVANNPYNPYVVINELPKLRSLKSVHPERYRDMASLVVPRKV